MDTDDNTNCCRKCLKIPYTTFGNLNLAYSKLSSHIVFYNTYQIFVYNDFNLKETPKIFDPEFNVQNVLVCNNYLICLDDNGNVHLTPMKFKNSDQKKVKSTFHPRELGIKYIEYYKENIISLKLTSNAYFICIHKVNNDFQIDSEKKLLFDDLSFSISSKKPYIFKIYHTNLDEYNYIKEIYRIKEIWKQHAIIFFSIDRINVYSVLFSSTSSENVSRAIKLYTSPSEISDINITKLDVLYVLIAISVGTIIKVPVSIRSNEVSTIHLNTVLFKCLLFKDNILMYTDGNAMWKCTNTFDDIKFNKCFVKQVKDFIIIGDQVICSTYSNLLYTFSIKDTTAFEMLLSNDIYCPADEVLNNSDCLTKIMDEVEKSNDIVKKIIDEESYITTLSLSNRRDIMDTVIDYNITVFETFVEIPKEDIILVDNIKEYYDMDAMFVMINIITKSLQENFYETLSYTFGNITIHLSLSTSIYNIKNICINAQNLKKINVVVPLKIKKSHVSKIVADIKLITSIPAVFDINKKVWIVLHSKKIKLNSEQFIKTISPTNQLHYVSEDNESVEEMIYKNAKRYYGHLFKFIWLKDHEIWSLYVKLNEHYENQIKHSTYINKHFNENRAKALIKQLTSEEFLKSKINAVFEIGCNKVNLEILQDEFTKPLLKISCDNLEIAFNIRNFCSNLLYNFTEVENVNEFVDHGLYSTIEKLEQSLKDCINQLPFSREELLALFEKYQKDVIGALPI